MKKHLSDKICDDDPRKMNHCEICDKDISTNPNSFQLHVKSCSKRSKEKARLEEKNARAKENKHSK